MTVLLGKNWALSVLAILILLAGCQKSTDRAPPFDTDKVYTGADGRAYRLERLEKKPDGYSRVSKTMLRYYPNGFYEVEREDDAYFYVRQYVPIKVEPPAPDATYTTEVSPPASDAFSWQPFDAGLPRAGQWRDNFAVADMNGDGFPDLIFAPARKTLAKPAVFLGNGKGKWTLWTQARYPAAPYDYGGAAAADFNADGKQDIALGMHLLGFAVLTGDGKGGFSDYSAGLPRKKSGESPTLSSRKAFAYDWNGDGKPALVVLNEHMGVDPVRGVHDGVVVFRNDKGTWTPVSNETPLQRAVLMAVDASMKKLALIEAPTPLDAVRVSERKGGAWNLHDVAGFPHGALLTAFAVADDRGGATASTFVVSYRLFMQGAWWTYIDLIEQREGRWQRLPLSAQRGAAGVTALAFAKLRPGEFHDIVVLDEKGEAAILRQTGPGTYTRDHGLPTPSWRAGCQGYGLQTVDLDKDGIDEVVASFAGEASASTQTNDCVSGGAIQAFKISSKH